LVLSDFVDALSIELRSVLEARNLGKNTVVAILGVGTLFGFTHVSKVVSVIQSAVRGRLLVFFPGTYEPNTYRLLDARDGWNYMAVPITGHEITTNG
jgi:Domain of unknown function (DUF1788)